MPVHISPALSARQVAPPSPALFSSRAARESKAEGWPLPRKPASRRVLHWCRYLNWNGLFSTRPSHLIPRRPLRDSLLLLPPLSRPSLFADISTVCHLSRQGSHGALTCWQTDAHTYTHTRKHTREIYKLTQKAAFSFSSFSFMDLSTNLRLIYPEQEHRRWSETSCIHTCG